MHWQSSPLYIRPCCQPDTNMTTHTNTYPTSRSHIRRPRSSHHYRCCLTHPPPPQHTPATFHAICTRLDHQLQPRTKHPPLHLHTSHPTHLISRCCNMGSFLMDLAILATPASPILLSLQPHAAVKRRQHNLRVIAQALTLVLSSWPKQPLSRIITDHNSPQCSSAVRLRS